MVAYCNRLYGNAGHADQSLDLLDLTLDDRRHIG